jgi:hypothetical protein
MATQLTIAGIVDKSKIRKLYDPIGKTWVFIIGLIFEKISYKSVFED